MFALDDFAIRLEPDVADTAPILTRKTSLALAWAALGGDETARWDERGNPEDLWLWVNRLGRGVHVYDPYGERIWRGLIYGVQAQIEGQVVAFSLESLVNQLAVQYSYISYLCPSTGDFQIAGAPSGNTLQYDDGAGGDPAGEDDLAATTGGATLHNVTQEEQAEIDGVDPATNTIVLTDAVPGTWVDDDDLAYGQVMGQTTTGWVGDTDSQARYGVKAKLVTRSGMTAAMAEAERDALLELRAWPLGEHGRGGEREDKVTVEAVGWWARCRWRLWHWTLRGVLSAADQAKLMRSQVLDFLSADETQISDIGHVATQHREDYNDVQHELLALAEPGDEVTKLRALVGVDDDKRLFLRVANTSNKYILRAGDRWYNMARQRLEPWRVRPDGYVLATDLSAVTGASATVGDPGRFYLERVEWAWPDAEPTFTPLGGRDLEGLITQGVRL